MSLEIEPLKNSDMTFVEVLLMLQLADTKLAIAHSSCGHNQHVNSCIMLSPCLWKSFDKNVAHLLVLVAIQTGMASEK